MNNQSSAQLTSNNVIYVCTYFFTKIKMGFSKFLNRNNATPVFTFA